MSCKPILYIFTKRISIESHSPLSVTDNDGYGNGRVVTIKKNISITLFLFIFLDDIEIEPLLEPSSGTDGDSEPVYGNVGLCTIVPVKVEDLWDYVKANKINDAEGLKREYRVSVLEYIQPNIDINTLQKGMKLIYLAKIFMDLLFIIIWLFFPQLIPAGLTASCEVAKKPENKDKNRYGNIIACKSSQTNV